MVGEARGLGVPTRKCPSRKYLRSAPDHGRSRSRGRLGNGGSASQTPLPRHRVGRGDGYRPASRQGSGTSTRTRHHDPRPVTSATSGKDTNQTSSRACVLYLVRQIYLRRTEGGDDDTSSTFRRDETIEFVPKLGEAAPIGRAPVRPRGRSAG